MKKRTYLSILALLFCFISINAQGQNVQLHYDTNRDIVTSTVEMFRADNCGSTFFFIDLDYSPKVSGAYWEISR